MTGTIRVLALGLLLTIAQQTAADDGPEEAADESGNGRSWHEQVEVSVAADENARGPLGASSTVLAPNVDPGTPSALTDLITVVPGVSENGQAGLFQVFSIRGLSRQRVTSLVAGMRVTSERRAGASSSFIDPTLMDTVEVLRGNASTYYGSGALGGVVRVAPGSFSGWNFGAGYDSNGDENYQFAGVGGDDWSIGAARRDAGAGEAADGTRLHSGFTQYSAVLRVGWGRGAHRYELLAIPTRAEEIGKASTDFPDRTTDYPLERHHLVRFSVASERKWQLQASVHLHDLETKVVEQEAQQQSEIFNDTSDYAVRWEGDRAAGERTTVRYGADLFGRTGVDAREERRDLGQPDDVPETFRTLDDAEENELGAYGSVRWNLKKTRWELGGRYSWIGQSNTGDPDQDRTAWNGHAGMSRSLGWGIELAANLGYGVRFPSLTELFFSGTTGRGQVLGNPGLDEERSLSLEVSTRWTGRRTTLGAAVFRNEIDDYIERIEVAPDLLTWVNVTSGTIVGLELEGASRLTNAWSLRWGGHLMESEDDNGDPLADTPPAEMWFGAVRAIGRWQVEAAMTLRGDLDDPGSGEKPIPSAELLTAAVRYRWAVGWELAIAGTNLLDESYFASADRKAPFAPGRAIAVHVTRRKAR